MDVLVETLDPFAGGAHPSFVALAAASAYILLGSLDSLNTVRTQRSVTYGPRGDCAVWDSVEKAKANKLSNLPSLRKLHRIGRHALEMKTPFHSDLRFSRPLDRIGL
jgi:hypothetical protein